MACSASKMPRPQVLVEQAQRPGFKSLQAAKWGDVAWGRAVKRNPAKIWSADSAGFTDTISAATPLAMGAEKLVP